MLIRCRSQSWVSQNPASFNLQSRECLQAQLLVCDCRAVGPGDWAERQACPATDPAPAHLWPPRAGRLHVPPLNMHLRQSGCFERIIFKTVQTQEKPCKQPRTCPLVRGIYAYKADLCGKGGPSRK